MDFLIPEETPELPPLQDAKSFLLGFSGLSYDVILTVFDYLPEDYIKSFFLYFPPTRALVIDSFYSKELHCIVTPLRKQKHVCVNGHMSNEIYDLLYFGEIDDFLIMNPDIIPKKLVFLTGTDFYSMFDLIKKYETRFLKSENIEILMDGCQYLIKDFEYILKTLKNISRLQLGEFKFSKIKQVLNNQLPQLEHLTTIQYLAHDVQNWQPYQFPPNLTSLDCSWFSFTNILSLTIPKTVTDLYLNHSGINGHILDDLINHLPGNLKNLMLTYNQIESFNCNHLPDSIEKLDILYNKTKNITVDNELMTIWPANLHELNLAFNLLNNQGIQSLTNKVWPENLKILTLYENKISDIYLLNNLPHSIEDLDLSFNNIKFSNNDNQIKQFKFPLNLKRLSLVGSGHLLDNFQTNDLVKDKLIFPPKLSTLHLASCGIKTLKFFKFPKTLKTLGLHGNKIVSLDSYEYKWENLINLESLVLSSNQLISLNNWNFPPNILSLNFSNNQLTHLSNHIPMFNKAFHKFSRFTHVDFTGNEITDINTIEIPNHKVELSLARNKLPHIIHLSPELFKLHQLDLSANGIKDFTYQPATSPQPLTYLLLEASYLDRERSLEETGYIYDKLEEAIGHEIIQRKFIIENVNLKSNYSPYVW